MTSVARTRQLLKKQIQLPQRKVAEVLDIIGATYCKVKRGERQARREQVIIFAELLNADQEELVKPWLADKVYDIVDEEDSAKGVFKIL
jgi:hypothetical protein